MIIRPARSKDLERIAAVHVASWQDSYRGVLPDDYLDELVAEDLARQWRGAEIGPDDVVLIAETALETLGFIAVWCRPDPFIDNLHVLPDHRSGGLGARLMRAAAIALLAKGHKTAHLWLLKGNDEARRFYQRLGGECVAEAPKRIYEYDLPSTRIEWQDLTSILSHATASAGNYPLGAAKDGLKSWPFTSPASTYRILAGDPRASGRLDRDQEHQRLGIWCCTPGIFMCTEQGDELQSLMRGRLRLHRADGSVTAYGPGDSFFTRRGERVVWEILETVEKVFFTQLRA